MAANRRRTERSENAAERARKAQRPADSRRTFTPRRRNCAQSKYVRIVGTKKEQQKRCPTAHIAFRARRTPCRAVFCSPLLRPGGEPSGARAPPKGRAKRRAPPTAAALSPCTIFRARRTPCRAAFCSPLLRTAGRKKARPAGRALARRQKPPRRAPVCERLLEKNKRGKTPRPNRLAEQKTALLCVFLLLSLFCKAFSKFS